MWGDMTKGRFLSHLSTNKVEGKNIWHNILIANNFCRKVPYCNKTVSYFHRNGMVWHGIYRFHYALLN